MNQHFLRKRFIFHRIFFFSAEFGTLSVRLAWVICSRMDDRVLSSVTRYFEQIGLSYVLFFLRNVFPALSLSLPVTKSEEISCLTIA